MLQATSLACMVVDAEDPVSNKGEGERRAAGKVVLMCAAAHAPPPTRARAHTHTAKNNHASAEHALTVFPVTT